MLRLNKNTSPESDETLLQRYLESADERAFDMLCNRYVALCYGLCLKYLKNADNAKDMAMQILESLPDKLHKHEVKNFKSWFYIVSKNYCLMRLREEAKRKNVIFQDNFMESADEFHLDKVMEDEQKMQALEACIAALPSHQRVAVTKFFLEELSYRDIVDVTGYELSKIKSFIQNGKRNLKICLENKKIIC